MNIQAIVSGEFQTDFFNMILYHTFHGSDRAEDRGPGVLPVQTAYKLPIGIFKCIFIFRGANAAGIVGSYVDNN